MASRTLGVKENFLRLIHILSVAAVSQSRGTIVMLIPEDIELKLPKLGMPLTYFTAEFTQSVITDLVGV